MKELMEKEMARVQANAAARRQEEARMIAKINGTSQPTDEHMGEIEIADGFEDTAYKKR